MEKRRTIFVPVDFPFVNRRYDIAPNLFSSRTTVASQLIVNWITINVARYFILPFVYLQQYMLSRRCERAMDSEDKQGLDSNDITANARLKSTPNKRGGGNTLPVRGALR